MERYKKFIKNIILKSLPKFIYHDLYERQTKKYQNLSFAQEGEDLILTRIFELKPKGFFVDVGAHHPLRFSNTYSLYLKGWRGINIDATPGSMEAFKIERPEDINLEVAISDTEEILTYYIFNDTALNTFSDKHANEYIKNNNFKILSKIQIQTQLLESILDKYIPQKTNIDFLTIDAEGFDFKILKSNNWIKFKPEIVLIESLYFDINTFFKSELFKYMFEKGYEFYAKTVNTVFFKLKGS